MPHTQYLALLRGINVGGASLIKMAELKKCFEGSGLEHVSTHIQSGNVIFEASAGDEARLTKKLESAISKAFSHYQARIVLCSHAGLTQVVRKAPSGFGSQPDTYRYDTMFLKAPLTASKAMKSVATRPGVDEVAAGPGVLYTRRLIARSSQSYLTRLVGSPIYTDITVRNWNTTTKLLALMDERARASSRE
jgi:uncharacterized protein (DUF1697 family)